MKPEIISEKRWEDARMDLQDFYNEIEGGRFWNSLDDTERQAMHDYATDLEMGC